MGRRYRKAGEVAGQLAIAATLLIGALASGMLIVAFVLAAALVTS